MSTNDNPFARLASIDVTKYVERKGQFSYLSWPFAVAQLRLFDPTATWEVKRFDNLPYLSTALGVFVEVSVTVQGVTLSQIHPVLDAKNRVIDVPSAFDINTSIQRALVKAIALHGLGISVYAGEDLPLTDGVSSPPKPAEPEDQPKPATVARMPLRGQASAAQLGYIERLLEETGSDVERLLEFFGVSRLDELTSQAASRAIRSLEQKRRAA
ncbi:MAG: DUF1071 domain-containing protein [Burkholderiaceae bacterium]